jgi:glycosyltransferase involved in cell wall biosynthesis
VYVGGLSVNRGILQMLELVETLNKREMDVGLWLLGTYANDGLKRDVEDKIDDRELTEKVRHFERVDNEKIFSYLSTADIGLVLLNPEQYERAISTKIFEYLYSCIPAVATDTTANSRYVTDEVGKLVPWDDTMSQADTVEELLKDGETRERLGYRGRELVEEKYSWESEAVRLLNFYERVLGSE